MTNLNEIEKYVDSKLAYDIVDELAEKLMHTCGKKTVYSYDRDELIVLVCGDCVHGYEEKLRRYWSIILLFPCQRTAIKSEYH